jgi:allantoate deiminase
VYAGAFDKSRLALKDKEGVTLAEAVRDFRGDPDALEGCGRGSEDLIGYCEVHIEQGPVLDDLGLPVGVVTAIAGQSRIRVGFTGKAGHAGTVPMQGRKDALCAAAESVLEIESTAKAEPGTVATVGEIKAFPGALNVIPSEATHSMDLRHQDDAVRERLRDHLKARVQEIAASRGCGHEWELRQETAAVPAEPGLSALLGQAVEEAGMTVHRLPSGAGHDAAQMSTLTPIAMLFVRNEDGISHNPAESVEQKDVGVAIEVMMRFFQLLAEHDAKPSEARSERLGR